jgi:hypothetical protein
MANATAMAEMLRSCTGTSLSPEKEKWGKQPINI